MAYGTIEYAKVRANEWRDNLLAASVTSVQRLGTPLSVDLPIDVALTHIETWYLGRTCKELKPRQTCSMNRATGLSR